MAKKKLDKSNLPDGTIVYIPCTINRKYFECNTPVVAEDNYYVVDLPELWSYVFHESSKPQAIAWINNLVFPK